MVGDQTPHFTKARRMRRDLYRHRGTPVDAIRVAQQIQLGPWDAAQQRRLGGVPFSVRVLLTMSQNEV